VEVQTAAGVVVGASSTVAAGATSLVVAGLTNGLSYRFRVEATNAVGTSAPSALSVAVTPAATAPGAPRIGTATRGNASALVRWTAQANGGSPVTGYTVQVTNAAGTGFGPLRAAAAGTTALTVTGLVNGTAVRFRVRARNAIGTGGFSALSNVLTPARAPAGPVIGTATAGAPGGTTTAVARWAPASNGGSAITAYLVTALRINAAGRAVAQTTSAMQPATHRSLTMTLPAGSYRFMVRARNAVGLGGVSARSNLVRAR